jgi:serine/threonine protein kinase
MSADVSDARLSKYRLIRLLGSGGMGSVYLAHDPSLNRNVAIKFVAPERIGDAASRRRLIREAQAAAALDHPSICAVHEVVTDTGDGSACIVMAYVEGETLAERLSRGPLEVRDALLVATHLADALVAAHRRGIIHRDIKTQNIMLTPSGRPKLLDFGIATVLDSGSGAKPPWTETHTDPVMGLPPGTPGYMSPEQVQQRRIDARSDLFSLGVVLFEALTGKRAFQGATALEVHSAVLHHHPPPVSSLRPGLTDQHDELCRRLLAKDPADRFQSAEELLGALRVLAPDTSHPVTPSTSPQTLPESSRKKRWLRTGAVAVLVALTGLAVWRWRAPEPLPTPTSEAQRWFTIGTNALYEGAYYSGLRALGEAVRLFPEYPQAYIRMAEAYHEIDQSEVATNTLLRVDARRLPTDDRLRHDGIRALLIRSVEDAIQAYRILAEKNPSDAGPWLDLGRAQEHAGLLADARGSYERAIAVNAAYAPAHLRLGAVQGDEGRQDKALASYAEAERLYIATSNTEGEVEALLRRGALLDTRGEPKQARAALEKAQALARDNRYQSIRAQLYLSSVTASDGRFSEAAELAGAALKAAEEADLDQIAAMGLIELGYTLLQLERTREADAYLDRAIALAAGRGARRTEARARLQQASLRIVEGRHAEALAIAESTLDFLRKGHYRRYELTAMAIIVRAREQLGDRATTERMAEDLLKIAEEAKDDTHIAFALEPLAELATIAGELPRALAHRLRLVDTNRRLQDRAVLPYDLTNSSYLLIRLGRGDEAAPLMKEVEDGIAEGVGAYIGRARRLRLLRALDASTRRDFRAAAEAAEQLVGAPASKPDSTTLHATALLEQAYAHMKPAGVIARSSDSLGKDVSPSADTAREVTYLQLLTRLARGERQAALDAANSVLTTPPWAATPEIEWRIAAIGAAAARQLGDTAQEKAFAARARAALERLRTSWKDHVGSYERRADLVELRRQAGLE